MQELEGAWPFILSSVATALVVGFITTLADQPEAAIQLTSSFLGL